MTAPMTAPANLTDPFAAFQTPGASYIDPISGQPIQGAASAPAGTPFYQSAQLVQNADGSTASATGTEANPFAGFVDANGGGFGADTPDPARVLGMDAASSDPTRIATALNSTDPDAQAGAIERLTAPAATGSNQLGALEDSTYASSFTPAWFQSLTPAAQAQVTAGLQASGGDPQAIDQQLANLGASGGNVTKLGGDASGTYQYVTDPASVQAANAADAALPADTAPPVDTDPFGQFDSAQNPTHGVITPAYEAQLAAQSQQTLLNETTAGAVPAALASSATGSISPPAGETASPPTSATASVPAPINPTPPITTATGAQFAGSTPAPIGGQSPVVPPAGVGYNPLDTTTVGPSGVATNIDPNNPFAQFTGAPTMNANVLAPTTAPVAPKLSPTGA